MNQLEEFNALWNRINVLPIKYELDYNDPTAIANLKKKKSAISAGEARKQNILIREVTLRALDGRKVTRVKLSHTDRNLNKLVREGASLLGCPEAAVILVRRGRVLGHADETVVQHIVAEATSPIYCFDRCKMNTERIILDDAFKLEFAKLLQAFIPDQRKTSSVVEGFMNTYQAWL